MPVVLVIIILVAWIVILGPSLLKRRARGGGDQSITHFHYQLRVLEQRAPEPIVAPAYRLRAVSDTGAPTSIHYPDSGRAPVLTVVGAKELPRPALAFLGEPEVAAPAPSHEHGEVAPFATRYDGSGPATRPDWLPCDPPVGVEPGPRGPDPLSRAQARRRRRDTLTVLGGIFAVTLLAGLVSGSMVAWAVVALDGVALVAYVALLVQMRRAALEREMKLHYLDPRVDRPARAGGSLTYMSGRYAHPSNQQALAR